MPDAFSVGVSVYAAAEAAKARRELEELRQEQHLKELREFVSRYSHDNASPEDREKYVRAVHELYPATQIELTPEMIAQAQFERKCLAGGGLLLLVGLIASGVYGHYRHGDAGPAIGTYMIALILVPLTALIVTPPVYFVVWAVRTLLCW